jgi:D-amino-acid dehydrogenase
MKAVVIGGGIIGLSTAYYLSGSGWEVTVVDSSDLSDNCSFGNMGMIVPSHFVPLAAPGMMAKGIRWMFNSKSPFYVRPVPTPSLLKWGMHFRRSSTRAHVERSASSLLDLNLKSRKLYEEIAATKGFDFNMESKGILMYYQSRRAEEEETELAEKAGSFGLNVEVLNSRQLTALEPGVEMNVMGAIHYKDDAHILPQQLMPQLIRYLKLKGVQFKVQHEVKDIKINSNSVTGVHTDKGEITGDIFVFAGGAWLQSLLAKAGISIPLMPGKGYSFTNEAPTKKLNIPAILCEAKVAITPMKHTMRYGGTMEIGSINNRINFKRVEGIVDSVKRYFPGLEQPMPSKGEVWYGFRPCSPDGLPYIGRSRKFSNLFIGGGHSMMGLSAGPATGKIIADLANDKDPGMDLSLFTPERFQ